MVVNLSILKNNGFVKGAFIASVVLAANGNGVCYGMKEGGKSDITNEKDNKVTNEGNLGFKLNSGKSSLCIFSINLLSTMAYNLGSSYFFKTNPYSAHLGWYADLKTLSWGWKYNPCKQVSLDFGIAALNGIIISFVEFSFIKKSGVECFNKIGNYLLYTKQRYIFFYFLNFLSLNVNLYWNENMYIAFNLMSVIKGVIMSCLLCQYGEDLKMMLVDISLKREGEKDIQRIVTDKN